MNKKLINATLKQLGERDNDQLKDIANYGIQGGFGGFISYADTVKFFKSNRAEIKELVEEYAQEMGENPIDFVAGFNCLSGRNWKIERATRAGEELTAEIGRALYGRLKSNDNLVANALAWFAGEEVARFLTKEKI